MLGFMHAGGFNMWVLVALGLVGIWSFGIATARGKPAALQRVPD